MITKKISDHIVKTGPMCGEIREILPPGEYDKLDIAIAIDIEPTVAHYHKGFDEVYFLLDGSLEIQLFDPNQDKTWSESLVANELCVIEKGIHHQIVNASKNNRLAIICIPGFNADDEPPSHLSR